MAYKLTLTLSERMAIDWIGDRYTNGDELFSLLQFCEGTSPEDADWDDERDLTFDVPEHVAWAIRDNAEREDGTWPCFSPDLASKLQAFCDAIV